MSKLGLALGSGGARGFVHFGVIKALEENSKEISYVSGASIGALVGAMYCAGRSIAEMEEAFKENKWDVMKSLFDFTVFSGGVVKGKKLRGLVKKWIGVETFEELNIPFACVATDLCSGKQVVFKEGDLISAVAASMAVPGMFAPIEVGDCLLVDGGVCNPVPDDLVREMGAEKVVAVNLDHRIGDEGGKGHYRLAVNVSTRSLNILRHYLAEYGSRDADVVIAPEIDDPGVVGFKTYFKKEGPQSLVDLGYKLMKDQLGKLS